MRVTAAVLVGLAVSVGAASVACAEEAAADALDPSGSCFDEPVPRSACVVARASASGSGRALFDSLLVGGQGELGIGLDSSVGSYGLSLAFFGGVLEGGFAVVQGMLGFDATWPLGPVRIGVRPGVGYVDIDRLTSERQFGAYALGIGVHGSVDVLRSSGVAFAVGVEPSATVLAALGNDGIGADGAAPLLGASIFLEARWRPPRGPSPSTTVAQR